MKPYPNYKGNKLTNIVPTAIALVTEGANRKKFALFKLKQEGVSMKKETALTLIKGGSLSENEVKLVIANVVDADRAEVQKAADDMKKAADNTSEVDVEKLAVAVADKIVKAQEKQLTAIVESLKQTTTVLEKMATGKTATTETDPELSEAELQALIEAEGK